MAPSLDFLERPSARLPPTRWAKFMAEYRNLSWWRAQQSNPDGYRHTKTRGNISRLENALGRYHPAHKKWIPAAQNRETWKALAAIFSERITGTPCPSETPQSPQKGPQRNPKGNDHLGRRPSKASLSPDPSGKFGHKTPCYSSQSTKPWRWGSTSGGANKGGIYQTARSWSQQQSKHYTTSPSTSQTRSSSNSSNKRHGQ